MRKTYISNNDVSRFDDYLAYLGDVTVGEETIPTADACGRVTAQTVFAKVCDPMYNAAAMDGIAVSAAATASATEKSPLALVENQTFVYVNTGNAIDPRFDAVIMIEDVTELGDGKVEITAPAYPWQHVRVKGESIVAGEMVLPAGRKIRPVDVGAIFASGNIEIPVLKKPVVGVITTGDEMVEDPSLLASGKLMESNSRMFCALIGECGGVGKRYPTVKDVKSALSTALNAALSECDLVIVNAGSSAGTKDYAVDVMEEAGEVFLHGFAIKPGKPTILARAQGKPVIGVPGYPVSAYLVFELFVRPVMLRMLGQSGDDRRTVRATLTRNVVSSLKNAEYVRMSLGKVGGKLVATPLERGAAQIMSLVKADGLMFVDRYSEGYEGGAEVEVELRKPLSQIEKNLVIIGSHDLVIDVIGEKIPVSSAHVGSMGGIYALQKGECHIAPVHLLDAESGEYNIPYIRKYFVGEKMVLVKGVGRTQGLMLPKGNPKNIKSVADIVKGGHRFANRQRGAGTRLLFDYMLAQGGFKPDDVDGYAKEYSTHLAVGMAVECGAADVGLGVGSAANCLGLDFVPLYDEEYDFLMREESLNDERIRAFLDFIVSDEFRGKLLSFGDYTAKRLGEIIKLC